MTTLETIRAEFIDLREKIEALPNTGSVLFCTETGLGIVIPDRDAARGYIAGLIHAYIFTDADRFHNGNPPPGLDRLYTDGANRRFMLTTLPVAKRRALAMVEAAIAALPMVESQP